MMKCAFQGAVRRRVGVALALALGLASLSGCGLFERDVPPATPTDLRATQGDYVNLVLLVWTPVEGADRYEVHRAGTQAQDYELTGESAQALYEDTAVTAGRTYWYRVRACNPSGCSELSAEASGFAAAAGPQVPLPPTGIMASQGEYTDRIRVSWEPVQAATEYLVHRAEEQDGTYRPLAGTENTSHDDQTAEPGETYWYRVRSCNDEGCSSLSSAASGHLAPNPPPPPTEVNATDGTEPDLVRITWAPAERADSYEVHRSAELAGTYDKIGTTTSTVYDDTEVESETPYWYRVRACNPGGCSDLSEADSGYAGTTGESSPPLPPS